MAAPPFSNAPAGDPVQPCPLQNPTHWIEIQLVDDQGNPVAYEEYLVTLTDGSDVRGYLDENGWARFAPLTDAGTCKVAFPGIDSKAWQYDHSGGARQQS